MSRPGPDGTVPWPPGRVTEEPLDEVDVDRLMVFVPAIMSVGLAFSIATLVRDLFHWTGNRARERRTAIEAGAVVSTVLGEEQPDPEEIGVLSRPLYLLSALVLVTGAAYVTVGSVANFVRDGGYVRDIGWLLAVSLGLAVVLGFLAGVSFVVFLTWPHPPAWTFGPLRTAPLSVVPGRQGQGPSWGLTAGLGASAVATGLLSLMVGSGRSVALDIDRPIARWFVEAEWLGQLEILDLFGRTLFSIGFVVLIGLSFFRCRVMAIAYPVAFAVSWLGGGLIREIVDRDRPAPFGDLESYPSGHLIQAVFIAGLVPLAIAVLSSDRRAVTMARTVLGLLVVATAAHRIHRQDHWPLDVLGGIGLGLTVVLAVHWALEHRSWHRSCASCPWSRHPAPTPWRQGIFSLGPGTAHRLGMVGALGAVVGAAALFGATVVVGLPTDPEGFGLGSAISGPVQIGLATVLALSGLVALRWQAVGAVGIALAATGLGLFASVQYRPLLTFGLTAALVVPAVVVWLSWQREETVGRIFALAAITGTLLTGTAFGTTEIYDYYFGPTHPDSAADELASEEADWLWLGAVDTRSATVVAGGLDSGEELELRYWAAGTAGADGRGSVAAVADRYGVARFVMDRLSPATTYRYSIVDLDDVDDADDRFATNGAGDAGFRTIGEGPQDLVVVLGSCARSGSNGAVFDAMVAEQPDLYLALGDLHYANLESTNPADHIRAYGRSLRQPGQAALFSSVPTAYVWDDHDYGPNDSDGSSISRSAVSTAYRRAVPHHGVDPDIDATIAQAFTVGRVRFVLSDTHSHRTPTTMLGAAQQEWLVEELISSSASHALVVWANPTPWIGAADPTADGWSAYPEQRQAIADALAAAGVANLVMVSGDAHMVAIDDGTNSGYAADGSPGFPLLHAAALDRPGSVKGGPYSHGAFPGGGQYGKLVVADDGGATIGVELSGKTWDGERLVSMELQISVPRTASGP